MLSTRTIAFAICAFLVHTNVEADLGKISPNKKANRKISSVSPNESKLNGQGLSMLRNVTQTKPGFLSSKQKSERVQVQGLCRDTYGYTSASGTKKYDDCLEDRTRVSGASVNNYFGPAQRAAGMGIVLGDE